MTKLCQYTLGQGKPIVMIHGWAMHSHIWRNFAEALSAHFRVTCIDLPGHGCSDKIHPFTLESITSALAKSVDEPPCCWLGWSLGATVALDFAGRFPGRVSSLILLAGNPSFTRSFYSPVGGNPPLKGSWPGMNMSLLDAFLDKLIEDPQTTLLRFLALQVHGLSDAKTLLKELKDTVNRFDPPDPDILRQGLRILKHEDLRTVLAKANIPIAAILGGKDNLIPVEVGEKMRQLSPGLELSVIDKAGHVPFLTHEQELVAIISRFLGKQ
ncbi:MAG: pimeloyl-ACP methyl ester esterase BioH [Gammaproteobacteria bacterium]